MVSSGALVAVGRGASVAVGAAPDPVVVDVRAGEAGVSVGMDAVRSGACHAGRLVRAAGREHHRKGQRKDNAQQGHVSCRACTGNFLSLPVLTSTIYPQIHTDNIAELLWVSMLRHPFRHSQICVGMAASAGMSGRARTGLVFAGSQPR